MKKNYSVNTNNSGNHFGIPSRLSSLLPLLLVAFCLFGMNERAWGQSYQENKWWSLYETKSYHKSTNTGGTIHTYTAYPPNSNTISLETKIEERPFGVNPTGFGLTAEGATITVSDQEVSNSQYSTGPWYNTKYYWNYIAKTGTGVDEEASSFDVDYTYKLGNAARTVYIQNVKVEMKPHIRLKSSNNANGVTEQTLQAFNDTKWGTLCDSYKTVYFRSFLTGPNDANKDITITSSDPTIFHVDAADNTESKVFSPGKNKFAYTANSRVANSLNAQDYTFRIYFTPAEPIEYEGTITITDGYSTAYVYVSGKGTKRNQTIYDFATGTETHNTTDVIPDFAAYTKDDVTGTANNSTVTYASDKTGVATVDQKTGKVKIITEGTVKFTASVAESALYNATSKSVTYTINKVTPAVTWPTIESGLQYNNTCAIGDKVSDHWSGGFALDDKNDAVKGSFTCNDYLLPESNEVGYSVTFTPENTDWYNPKSTTLKQDVEKADQTITWDLVENEEYPSGTAMTATATSGLTITYSTSDASVAEIVNDALKVKLANRTVTLYANQGGNANWNAAPQVSKEIKTCGARPDYCVATATDLVYGQTLEESTLTGEARLGATSIDGTFAWVSPTMIPTAGSHTYQVKFQPVNTNSYGSMTIDVNVTVAKATPELTWKIGNLLRENSTYSNFVLTSNQETQLNISTSNSTLLQVTDRVLTTGNISGDDAVIGQYIVVSQAATDNYNALAPETLAVTINNKVEVCLPVVMNESLLDNMVVNSKEEYAWYNSNDQASATYKVLLSNFDVKYTQTVGVGLGTWKDGLSGLSWTQIKNLISGNNEFSWTPKWIELSFTGVPDRVQFSTALQNVSFNLAGWHEVSPTAAGWLLFQSEDGVNFTQVGTSKEGATYFNEALDSKTRYIRIEYRGNFTGFVKDLTITQKKSLQADKANLVFGTNDKPLQEPQTLKVSYSSLGSCGDQSGNIVVTTDNPAFYVDETDITDNVGIDQMGEYTVRVRCNDVKQSGNVIFTAYDGTTLSVPVSSSNPIITSAGSSIFQTGSEHAPSEDNTAYRAIGTHDFASCFSGTTALFDTLYIYGVTESAARAWELDANKGYGVPAFTVTDGATAGTAYTPCFVFAKSGNEYVYNRTFDATNKSLAINAEGKRLWFAGYKTVSSTTVQPAIAVSGSAHIYLSNVEMNACGAVLTTSNAATVKVHARGTNNLNVTGNASAVALDADNTSALVVEDSWLTENVGVLNLNGAAGLPTVNLGNASNSLTINGAQVTLKNGTRMAVAYLSDGVEQVQGAVHINDGTILGESVLGLPARTSIDGGTFNDGTVRVYTRQGGNGSMPRNTEGELLARRMMAIEEVPAGYGKAHLIPDGNLKVYPMLLNENVYEYNEEDGTWETTTKWNHDSKPGKNDIVVVSKNVTVNTEVEIASLTIEDGGSLTIEDGGVVVLAQDGYDQLECASYGNLIVKKGGRFETNNNRFEVKDFYIESALGPIDGSATSAKSGQVTDATALVVDGDAYFDLILDQSGRCSAGWYDFSVPFPVDNRTGISRFQNGTWKTDLQTEQHYAIMTYHEEIRAKGEYGWKKYYGIMQPGVCYTITVNNTAPLYRFRKVANAPIEGNHQIPLQVSNGLGDDTNKGWNCIGNSTLSHASVWADNSVSKVQIYDHASNTYTAFDQYETAHLPVGTAIFVQVLEASNMHFEEVVSYAAPQRVQGRTLDEYLLTFTAENNTFVDKLYLSASEDAENSYQIGHDLVKFGTSTTVAQIWADAYGQKLCDVEAPLVNDQAIIPISLYAPGTDSYTLDVVRGPQDASLYLMYEGAVVWNLSQSAYTLDLTRGTTTGYSLLVTAEAPSVTTGVDAVQSETKSVEKIILNGNLYILRDGEMYDATGKKVK